MENAHNFIDENIHERAINEMFIRELHKIIVKNLTDEGSKNPGEYRKLNVRILQSNHCPPDVSQVKGYMDELFSFFNEGNHSSKFDLLKTAICHHRFAWIHPFDNGNGRTVRLLTYAMLVKQGFNIKSGRIINPTAIFCIDRNKYYNYLSYADSGKNKHVLNWCEYVLSGLKNEIDKIDKLLDSKFLTKFILIPMVRLSLDRKMITPTEAKILNVAVKKQIIKAHDIKNIFPNKISAEISRMIKGLRNKKMLIPVKGASSKYVINFENSFLLRSLITMLEKNKFLSVE